MVRPAAVALAALLTATSAACAGTGADAGAGAGADADGEGRPAGTAAPTPATGGPAGTAPGTTARRYGTIPITPAGDGQFTVTPGGSSPSTRPPRPTTTPPPPLPAVARPFGVGGIQVSFTDTGRPAGDKPVRLLRTTVWYPAAAPATQRGGQLPAANGVFPVVVFAHGWAVSAADYARLLQEVAAAGYIVVAPDFPLTSRVNGAVDERDTFNEPLDLSFLIGQVQSQLNTTGVLAGRVWSGPVGAMGQSDGATVVMALGMNDCCIDARVASIVALSGKASGWVNGWFPADSTPVLDIHGDNDTINPIANGRSVLQRAAAGSALVTVAGGDHAKIFTSGEAVPAVAKIAIDWLDLTLRKDSSARARFEADATAKGYALQRS